MRLNLNGKKYKYLPSYFKYEDKFDIKNPSYLTNRCGEVFFENEWKECHLRIRENLGTVKVYVSPTGFVKNGQSELGKLDNQGYFDIIKLDRLNLIKIHIYDLIFGFKLFSFQIGDKIMRIPRNLFYILLAFIIAAFYFEVNYFFDNYFQKMINESNFIQSTIIFLSLSSIINIFHPFSLRKEVSLEEVDNLIIKRREELMRNWDGYKETYTRTKKYKN